VHRQLVLQAMQRQMRLLVDPPNDEGAMRLKNPATVATHLAGRDTAGPPVALRPLHNRRNRNAKPRRHRPATPASLNRTNNALAKIIRIGSGHACWPPYPSQHLESHQTIRVNPHPILSNRETL